MINQNQILYLINYWRNNGCQCGNQFLSPALPVTWNPVLEQVAYIHSKDMSDNQFHDHVGTDGYLVGYRATKLGYSWNYIAENIGCHYFDEQSMMDGWFKSEGHCKNMMNPIYTEIGASRVGDYWTLVMAKPF